MSNLKISFFGGLTISFGDICLNPARSHRQLRLLTYLLLNRGRASDKRELADICFGYGEYAGRPEAALNALNALIHRLRLSLSKVSSELSDSVVYENGAYRIMLPRDCEIDTEKFEALNVKALTCTRLSEAKKYALEAISLYKGTFLSGALYDASVRSRAENYASAFVRLVEFACKILRSDGDLSSIDLLTKKAIAIDPLCESFRYERLSVLCEMGKTDEARRLYNETVELFAKKLSIAPSEGFRALGEKALSRNDRKTLVVLSEEHSEKVGEIPKALALLLGGKENDINVIIK